jgi:hypothetical protein
MVVWLRAAVDSGEVAIIVVLTYLVGLGGFTHIVVGSVEYLYLVFRGLATWDAFAGGYMIPAGIGWQCDWGRDHRGGAEPRAGGVRKGLAAASREPANGALFSS